MTLSTLRGVKQGGAEKRVGPKRLFDADLILRQLQDAASEHTLPGLRDKLALVITSLRREAPEAKRGKLTRPDPALPVSERTLWEADQKLHAFRTVGRMLCAGQPFAYLEEPKKTCLADLELLLGDLCDITRFPVWGGRQFIAEILSTLLCCQVSLQDINRWFVVPNSQSIVVQPELLNMLSARNMTWPPNAHLLLLCQSYREKLTSGRQPFMPTSGPESSRCDSAASASSFLDDACNILCPYAGHFGTQQGMSADLNDVSSYDDCGFTIGNLEPEPPLAFPSPLDAYLAISEL